MSRRRGIAAGIIVLASLSACFLDWDLDPKDAGPRTSPNDGAIDGTIETPNDANNDVASPITDGGAGAGCTTNSNCTTGQLCYFASCGGTGQCITASMCGMASAGTLGAAKVCTCGADACAPTGAVGTCQTGEPSATKCGYLQCPSSSTFCEISEGATKYECKAWAAASCGSDHSCNCAKKVCNGGTCTPNGNVVVTCP